MRITIVGVENLALEYAMEHFGKKGCDISFAIFEKGEDGLRIPEDMAARLAGMAENSDLLAVNAEELADAASFAAYEKGVPCFGLLENPPLFASKTMFFCDGSLGAFCGALDAFISKPAAPKFRIALVHDGNPLGAEFLSMLGKEIRAAGHEAAPLHFRDIFGENGFSGYDLFLDFCGSQVLSDFFASRNRRLVRPIPRGLGPDTTLDAALLEIGRLPKDGKPVFADVSRASFKVGETLKSGYTIMIDEKNRAVIHVVHATGGQADAELFLKDGSFAFHVLENSLPEDDVLVSGLLAERLRDGVVSEPVSVSLGKRRGKSFDGYNAPDFGHSFPGHSLEEREAFFRD